MSHDDHNEPATKGYTITGMLNFDFECLNIDAHVYNVRWCGETKIMSMSFKFNLWPVK